MRSFICASILITVAGAAALLKADEPAKGQPAGSRNTPANSESPQKQPAPKPLGGQVSKGIAYLVAGQHADGGWGQGGGWRSSPSIKGGRVEGNDVADPSDVGNTAMTLLVLLRAGNTPDKGPYAAQFAKGLGFLYTHVESADDTSLYVTDVRDTQLQTKIGPYVDTFAATWLMAELKGSFASPPKRLLAALDKTISKIERNQKADGTFGGNRAWASVLSQGICAVALNTAAKNGVKVAEKTLKRDFELATNNVDVKTGSIAMAAPTPPAVGAFGGTRRGKAYFETHSGGAAGGVLDIASAPAGSSAFGAGRTTATAPSNAGVELYQLSAQSAGLNANVAAEAPQAQMMLEMLDSPTATEPQKKVARKKVDEFRAKREVARAAAQAVQAKARDPRFMAGFGNNGGEEFLSYMNIGLALHVKGGKEWDDWDRQISEKLAKAQNSDGSYSGEHCITGRTFCTSAALLTMMVDRAPLVSKSAVSQSAASAGGK